MDQSKMCLVWGELLSKCFTKQAGPCCKIPTPLVDRGWGDLDCRFHEQLGISQGVQLGEFEGKSPNCAPLL